MHVEFWLLGCWPVLLDTVPRSGSSLPALPVGGQPEQGGLPIIVGEKKRLTPAPRIMVPKVFTKLICLCLSTTGQRHRNSLTWTARTKKGMSLCVFVCVCVVCELDEHGGSAQIRVHVLSYKVFIGNR